MRHLSEKFEFMVMRDDKAEGPADGGNTQQLSSGAVLSYIKPKISTVGRTRLMVAMRFYVKSQTLASNLLHFVDRHIGFGGCK